MKEELTKSAIIYLSGLRGITIVLAIICFSELVFWKIDGDWGAFLWVTFHFVINPLVCLFYIVINTVRLFITKKLFEILASIFVYLILSLYIFLCITGNIIWPKIFDFIIR